MVDVLFHSLPSMVVNRVFNVLLVGMQLLLLLLLDLFLTPMVVLTDVVNIRIYCSLQVLLILRV